MNRCGRATLTFVVGLVAGVAALGVAGTADAHPLGNLSVNHYHGLLVEPTRIVDDAVVDTAEIPSAQAKDIVDANHDGTASPDELDHYAVQQCSALQGAVTLTVDGQGVALAVATSSFVYRSGQAGLPTGRLECRFEAPLDVTVAHSLAFADSYLADRVGWHEITAQANGVVLASSSVPAESITGRLDHYPVDLLTSPLAVETAKLDVAPIVPVALPAGATPVTPITPTKAVSKPGHGISIEALGPFAGFVDRINRTFNDVVGRRQLTVGIGTIAIVLALVLGASHALLPGHGKTVMAAYIAGRQGSVRDAVLVGATVTATHTGGVLLLGLALSVSTTLAGEVVLGWLGVVSGLLISALGLSLLLHAVRRKQLSWGGHDHGPNGHTHEPISSRLALDHADHGHDAHDHGHDHDHDAHGHDAHDVHDHGHQHGELALHLSDGSHPHLHVATRTRLRRARHRRDPIAGPGAPAKAAITRASVDSGTTVITRRGLVGMGVAGGLVPSPSALVVLLSAIALGRTVFGVVLVVAYGFGMASTLTLAGILLVRIRDRYQRRGDAGTGRARSLARRWAFLAPIATAILVVVVGMGLALRSAALV